MIDPPPRPPEPKPASVAGSWLSIALAGMLATVLFTILSLLTFNLFVPVLLVGVGLVAFGGFHYLLWGWWLRGVLEREMAEEQEAESLAAASRDRLRSSLDQSLHRDLEETR